MISAPDADVMKISGEDRLRLKEMIARDGAPDNTEHIRSLKHSGRIAADLLRLPKCGDDIERARAECSFLYNNYTDIFNRAFKRELDMKIMSQVLYVLKQIEDEKCDGHEGSLMVGKLLKQLYVDSALRTAANIDAAAPARPEPRAGATISWRDWKGVSKK